MLCFFPTVRRLLRRRWLKTTPTRYAVLDSRTNHVGGEPVQRQPAGHLHREIGEHEWQHPLHDALGGLLAWVRRGHGTHLLQHPHGNAHKNGQYRRRAGQRQVQPQEAAIQWNQLVYIDKRQPCIQVRSKTCHLFRSGGQRLHYGQV